MNSEEKIAVCVKDYGQIAEKQLKRKKSGTNWKVITDGELFERSIFCSVIEGEQWKANDSELIAKLLNKNVWHHNQEEDTYIIEQVLWSLKGKVGEDAIFLKLAYIALLGDGTKKSFIKAVIDIVYYHKTMSTVSNDVLTSLFQQIGLEWDKKVNRILESFFGQNGRYKATLDRIYRNRKTFFYNVNSRVDVLEHGLIEI